MTINNTPKRAVVVALCTERLNALNAHVPDGTTVIRIDGALRDVAGVAAVYQRCLDLRATLDTLRAQIDATLVAIDQAEVQRREADRALRPWVANRFGSRSKEAHDFGFPPPKAPVQTVETKVQAVARRQATRDARHTMGARQKERVKGTAVVLVASDGTEAGASVPSARTTSGDVPPP